MKIKNFKLKISEGINPVIIIFLAALLRLVPHAPNVAPIAAMALFGGAYLSKKDALIIPLVALFLSDIFLGFHKTMPFVYGSFIVIGLIGMHIKERKTFKNILMSSLAASILFFIITNFGVWLVGNIYPKTLVGLMDCYIAGLPFFRNTLLGDLLYVGGLFGVYELLIRFIKYKILTTNYQILIYANLYKNRR